MYHFLRHLFKCALGAARSAHCLEEKIPERRCMCCVATVSIFDGAECKAANIGWVVRSKRCEQAAFQLMLQRATELNGWSGPVLKRYLLIVIPDLLTADQPISGRFVQAAGEFLPMPAKNPPEA